MTMNDSVKAIIIFLSGSAFGSVITHYLIKKKYECIAREEINAVRNVYECREEKLKSEKMLAEAENANKEYAIPEVDYSDNEPSDIYEDDAPTVISPLEFGEEDTYECINLTYYADGILVDEQDEVVENIEAIVGDALEHFGEYEDDAVYVCNNRLGSYYEILRDCRHYHIT